MDKESITFGLSPEKLASLLKIGSEESESGGEGDKDQKRADLLREELAEALPLERSMAKTLPAALTRICDNLDLLADEPIGDLLGNPKSEISLIKKIKDYSKNLSKSTKSKAEHDIYIAIYYAAIASALIFHEQRITKFSFESLNSSFCSLVEKTWVPNELSSLFKQAGEVCQSKLASKKSKSESKHGTC